MPTYLHLLECLHAYMHIFIPGVVCSHGLVGFRTQRNKEQFETPFVVVYCDVEFSGKATDTRYWRNR